jgi:hypothetical protein
MPRIRKRTASALCASPPLVPLIAVVKKYFNSKVPRGVAMYLFEVTLLTVLSCNSTAAAMSRRINGRRYPTPNCRNASC